jgi:hypothetical protein
MGDRRRGLRRQSRAAGRAWKPAGSARCWWWSATTTLGSVGRLAASTSWPPGSRRGPGSRSRAARAPRVTASTTGRSSASTTMASVLLARPPSAGCWSAATSAPGSWPSTAALCPARCRWRSLSGWPGGAGHRGALPDRQGPGRLGPAPAAPLALLVPLGQVGDARPRLPGGGGVDRPGPRSCAVRADHADLQRGPAPVRGSGRSAHP